MATRAKRDTTRALELARDIQRSYGSHEPQVTDDKLAELVQVLETMDARTGKRDPSTKRKPVAKKAAKKKVAR